MPSSSTRILRLRFGSRPRMPTLRRRPMPSLSPVTLTPVCVRSASLAFCGASWRRSSRWITLAVPGTCCRARVPRPITSTRGVTHAGSCGRAGGGGAGAGTGAAGVASRTGAASVAPSVGAPPSTGSPPSAACARAAHSSNTDIRMRDISVVIAFDAHRGDLQRGLELHLEEVVELLGRVEHALHGGPVGGDHLLEIFTGQRVDGGAQLGQI